MPPKPKTMFELHAGVKSPTSYEHLLEIVRAMRLRLHPDRPGGSDADFKAFTVEADRWIAHFKGNAKPDASHSWTSKKHKGNVKSRPEAMRTFLSANRTSIISHLTRTIDASFFHTDASLVDMRRVLMHATLVLDVVIALLGNKDSLDEYEHVFDDHHINLALTTLLTPRIFPDNINHGELITNFSFPMFRREKMIACAEKTPLVPCNVNFTTTARLFLGAPVAQNTNDQRMVFEAMIQEMQNEYNESLRGAFIEQYGTDGLLKAAQHEADERVAKRIKLADEAIFSARAREQAADARIAKCENELMERAEMFRLEADAAAMSKHAEMNATFVGLQRKYMEKQNVLNRQQAAYDAELARLRSEVSRLSGCNASASGETSE